ncbi:MAG TPA: class I SAM-dependent methyltransferase [Phototrophicaceae bacterium]|nr:class I SAM-dependent methyltransferase [Phototrophicaceae bacterium]
MMTDDNKTKSLSTERFNQFAAGYVTNQNHAKVSELDRLIAIAEPQNDWVVLDVATGGGHTALKFAPYVKQVIATDLAPEMLKTAQGFITEQGAANVDVRNVEFKIADAEHLPFEAETFNLVTCRIAPHHFPNVAEFVRESTRVLKPGGTLLVQDQVSPGDYAAARYTDAFEKLRDPSHYRVLSELEWVATFQAAGLAVFHTEQLTKRHDLVHWAKMQGNNEVDIERLQVLLQVAPEKATEWMDAEKIGTPEATFLNHHVIIAGRKAN